MTIDSIKTAKEFYETYLKKGVIECDRKKCPNNGNYIVCCECDYAINVLTEPITEVSS